MLKVALSALLLWVTSAAVAAEPRRPIASTTQFAVDSALQQAARRMLGARPGELFRVTKAYSAYDPLLAAEYEKLDVQDRKKTPLGSFLRMAQSGYDGSVVDLALRFEHGRLSTVEPLRPVKLGGKSAFAFPALLREASEQDLVAVAPELARVFDALGHLPQALEGEDGMPRFTDPEARALLAGLKAKTPSLPRGTPMPEFRLTDRKGQLLTPARFAGKRALIVVALVRPELCRQVLDWVHRYDSANSGRFALAEVLGDDGDALEQYKLRGGELRGIVAADPGGTLEKAMRVTLMPSLLIFDRERCLLAHLEPPFASYDELAARLDRIE